MTFLLEIWSLWISNIEFNILPYKFSIVVQDNLRFLEFYTACQVNIQFLKLFQLA